MRTDFWLAGAVALTLASAAQAGDTVKIGFVSTFSGPTAVIGNDMRNSFELALDHLGRKMGGNPADVIYKDEVVGEEYTVWPSQLDFSAELTKARNSKAQSIFVFYPGAAGVQFLNQYAQAGIKEQMPLYTAFTVDELSLPLQKDNAIGVPGAQEWVNDLPNAENKRFVEPYRNKYPGLRPTYYGAQSYDAAQLINSAVVAVKGDTDKKDAMKAEMEKANFKSLRGPFKYGNNHIPIQNFYLQDVVKDADGELSLKTVATIVENNQDRFHDKCPMK